MEKLSPQKHRRKNNPNPLNHLPLQNGKFSLKFTTSFKQSEIVLEAPLSPDLKAEMKLQIKKSNKPTPKIPKIVTPKPSLSQPKFPGQEIIPGLYLGGKHDAKNFDWMSENGVKVVVNAAKEVRNFHEENQEIKYHKYIYFFFSC